MATSTIVDDSSPSIQYVGSWWGANDPSDTGHYDHTAHLTRNAGDKAIFTFQGTSISVFGSYGTDFPQSTYVLDGNPPVTFVPPNGTTTTQAYRQLFYQSPTVNDGEHTLTIVFSGPQGDWYWLDYLQYTPSSSTSGVTPVTSPAASPAASPAVNTPATTSGSTSYANAPTVIGNSAQTASTGTSASTMLTANTPTAAGTTSGTTSHVTTPTAIGNFASAASTSTNGTSAISATHIPTSSTRASGTSSSHAGAIAGGVVGAAAVLAIIALMFFLFRRRRRSQAFQINTNDDPRPEPSWSTSNITPFTAATPETRPTSMVRSKKITTPSPPSLQTLSSQSHDRDLSSTSLIRDGTSNRLHLQNDTFGESDAPPLYTN